MSLSDLLHADIGAIALIPYLLLVLTVLISPDSRRGKAAMDLLSLHPGSRNAPDSQEQPEAAHPAAAAGPSPTRKTPSTPTSRRSRRNPTECRTTPRSRPDPR
ncbi:hypothetical protein [Streptomyces yangpuensis]|uniref:hypothetical protein n=1 Tax=Streptomyces yangpuensis TaxID=1648182 RepID=UPI00380B6B8B